MMAANIAALNCASTHQKAQDKSNALIDGGSPQFVPVEEAPILLNNVVPEYPANALDMKVTGTIWVKSLVDTLGNVSEAMVLRDVGENISFFRQSAIDAAMKTKWKPARSKGKPIAVWVTYRIDFNIK